MSHTVHDRVSLEIARRVAAELPHRPEWLELARANLTRWMKLNGDAPGLLRNYEEWLRILDRPVSEIVQVLTSEIDDSQRLRSNSPFVGALSAAEIWEIKRRVRHDEAAA